MSNKMLTSGTMWNYYANSCNVIDSNMPKKTDNNPETLDGTLRMRLKNSDLVSFIAKSEQGLQKPYQEFIREIVKAFNDGRLRIIPTKDQKNSIGELYNVD